MGQQSKRSVLIVDDSPENLTVLGGVLRTNYTVRVATNGEKALRVAQADPPPDLILLDIMMPGMDGYEVCRRLKENPRTESIPVIFLTAMTGEMDEVKGFEVGAVDYITKPFRAAVVDARVRNALNIDDTYLQIARRRILHEAAALGGSTSPMPAPPAARLHLLGRARIVVGGEDLVGRIKYRKGIALLGYLATHAGTWQTREKLADLLWPEREAHVGRTNLRQVLSNLTAVFGEMRCLRRNGEAISWMPIPDLSVDLELLSDATLSRLMHHGASSRAWRQEVIESCCESLGGVFLEGFCLPDVPGFEEWLASARTFFQRKTALFFERLWQAQHEDGQLTQAVSTARRLVRLDPVQETHAMSLAALLAELGDRSGALEVLDSLEATLRTELGVAPGAQVARLREDICRSPAPAAKAPAPK
ncbi:MAG: response regulator [Betaproteobacteria bacterium]|nr:response regulator [Betaproteobacteria bacterium]